MDSRDILGVFRLRAGDSLSCLKGSRRSAQHDRGMGHGPWMPSRNARPLRLAALRHTSLLFSIALYGHKHLRVLKDAGVFFLRAPAVGHAPTHLQDELIDVV